MFNDRFALKWLADTQTLMNMYLCLDTGIKMKGVALIWRIQGTFWVCSNSHYIYKTYSVVIALHKLIYWHCCEPWFKQDWLNIKILNPFPGLHVIWCSLSRVAISLALGTSTRQCSELNKYSFAQPFWRLREISLFWNPEQTLCKATEQTKLSSTKPEWIHS